MSRRDRPVKRRDDVERAQRQARRGHVQGKFFQIQLDNERPCGVRILCDEDTPVTEAAIQFIESDVLVLLQSKINAGNWGLECVELVRSEKCGMILVIKIKNRLSNFI